MNEACRFTKKGEVIHKLQSMLLDEYGLGSVYSSVDELLNKVENTVLDCRSFDVVEVTDKSMLPLVKDFVKDLEKLVGRATCDDIIKSMKR